MDFEFKDNLPIFCYFSTKLWKRALTVVNRKMFLSGHAKSISLAGEGGRDLKNCHFAMTNEPFFILLGGGEGGRKYEISTFQITMKKDISLCVHREGEGQDVQPVRVRVRVFYLRNNGYVLSVKK